jgi:hypothetical protein
VPTVSILPLSAARCRHVSPSPFTANTSAPASTKAANAAECPFAAAHIAAVLPSSFLSSTAALAANRACTVSQSPCDQASILIRPSSTPLTSNRLFEGANRPSRFDESQLRAFACTSQFPHTRHGAATKKIGQSLGRLIGSMLSSSPSKPTRSEVSSRPQPCASRLPPCPAELSQSPRRPCRLHGTTQSSLVRQSHPDQPLKAIRCHGLDF